MRKLKTGIVVIAILISTCIAPITFASGPSILASDYLDSYTVSLTNTGTTVKVGIAVLATGIMDYVGGHTIYLYEKNGSSAWSLVATYTYTTTPSMMAANTFAHTAQVQYTSGIVGRQYYASVYVQAGNSSGSDMKSITSYTLTL